MTDDTHTWQCPDCPKKNSLAVWKCICGHVRKKPERGEGGGKDRRFCSFISASGRQCPLPGDVSDRIGADAAGYCSGHLKDRTGPIAEQIFDDNVRNYSDIIARLKGNDLLTWWNKEGRAQSEQSRAAKPAVDEAAEAERRRLEAEQLADEARIEREAVQLESGAFPDEQF